MITWQADTGVTFPEVFTVTVRRTDGVSAGVSHVTSVLHSDLLAPPQVKISQLHGRLTHPYTLRRY